MARKRKALNSCLLSLIGGSWSPDTVLGWYRTLIADKYDSTGSQQKKRCRARIPVMPPHQTSRTRPYCPEQNSYVESFIKTFKYECLNHLILSTDEQLRYVVREFQLYYNHERPHSGLGGRKIKPWPQDKDGEIVIFSRPSGLLESSRKVKKAA